MLEGAELCIFVGRPLRTLVHVAAESELARLLAAEREQAMRLPDRRFDAARLRRLRRLRIHCS
eukprot:6316331-Prymnesium_polylepis.1